MSSKIGTSSDDEYVQKTVDAHTSGGIDNIEKIIKILKSDEKWQNVWCKNLEKAGEIAEKRSGRVKFETTEAAVCGLVFKVGMLTNYDMIIIKEVLRRSEYEAGIDFDASKLDQFRSDAIMKIELE